MFRKVVQYRGLILAGVALFSFCLTFAVQAISPPEIEATKTEISPVVMTQLGSSDSRINWQNKLEQSRASGDILNQAIALSNLSLIYQEEGQWNLAQDYIGEGLTILESLPKTEKTRQIYAQSLDIQGKIWFDRGNFSQSLTTWQESGKIYQELGLIESDNNNQINQAKAMKELGLYESACQLLSSRIMEEMAIVPEESLANQISFCQGDITDDETLKEIEEKLTTVDGDRHTVIQLQLLGDILNLMGDLNLSEKVLKQGVNITEQSADKFMTDSVNLSLGNLWRAKGDKLVAIDRAATSEIKFNYQFCPNIQPIPDAKKDYDNALKKYQTIRDNSLLHLQANLNQLSLQSTVNAFSPDNTLLSKIDNLIQQNSTLLNSQFGDTLRLNYIQIQACLKYNNTNPNLSWDNLEQNLNNIIENSHNRQDYTTESYALGYLGRIYEQQANQSNDPASLLATAEKQTKQALSIAQSLDLYAPELAYQWQWQLGRILAAKNSDRAEILAAYRAAFNTLQSLRQELVSSNRDLQFSFRDEIEPLYRKYVDLLLQEEPTQDELKEARNVIEALQLAELDDFFDDACIVAENVDLDEIVPADTAILYPILLDGKIAVVYRLPDGRIRHTIKVIPNLDKFKRRLSELIKSLQYNVNPERYLIHSQTIYNFIFSENLVIDLESNPQIQTLAFVLDGQLRNIPISLLHDGNQYLIEKYAVVVSPGLSLLAPRSPKSVNSQLFIAGLTKNAPSYKKVPGGLRSLNYAQEELDNISQLFDNQVNLIADEQFTKDVIANNLSQSYFPIFHWVTHAQFSSNPEKTFIATWDDLLTISQLNGLIQSRTSSNAEPIELLVLSACETAQGDNRAALGLAGVAVRAGSQSTLASLWKVNDKSTATFMAQFYQELINNKKSKVQALQAVQQSFLNGEQNQDLTHPRLWGAFVLVGNWL